VRKIVAASKNRLGASENNRLRLDSPFRSSSSASVNGDGGAPGAVGAVLPAAGEAAAAEEGDGEGGEGLKSVQPRTPTAIRSSPRVHRKWLEAAC
jgi:hypothetical protein